MINNQATQINPISTGAARLPFFFMRETKITTRIDRDLFEPARRGFENHHDVRMTSAALVRFPLER